MTLLTAGALTDAQLPATASNVCSHCARLMQGLVASAGCSPSKTKILATSGGEDRCNSPAVSACVFSPVLLDTDLRPLTS